MQFLSSSEQLTRISQCLLAITYHEHGLCFKKVVSYTARYIIMEIGIVSSLSDRSRSSDNIEITSVNPQEDQTDDNRDEDAGISLIKVDIILLYAF